MAKPKKINDLSIEKVKNLTSVDKTLTPLEIKKITSYLTPKLTNKQRAFCFYYVHTNQDREQSVLLAGYDNEKPHYAQIHAYILLSKENIKQAIKEIIDHEFGNRKLTIEYNLFSKLQMIIDMDILDYLDNNGNVKKDLKEIPKPVRQLIKKIEVKYYGREADVKVLTLEILGKEFAMTTLMKYLNMIKPDTNTTNINILSEDVKLSLLKKLEGEEIKGIKEVN